MWIPLYSRMWILMLIIHDVNASVQQDVNTDVDYPRCEYFCIVGCEYWGWLSTMWTPLYSRMWIMMLIVQMWIPLYSKMWILMLIIHDVNTSAQQDVNTDVDYPRCECLCKVGCEFWRLSSTMWIPLYNRMWIMMLIIHDVLPLYSRCEYWCWLSTMWIFLYSRMWILILIIHDENIFV
jgi:hypothetical protein